MAAIGQRMLPVVVAVVLVALALANLRARATWHEAEDGVLWTQSAEGVVAREVATWRRRRCGPASWLATCSLPLAIAPIDSPADVLDVLHRSRRGEQLTYTVLRQGATWHRSPAAARHAGRTPRAALRAGGGCDLHAHSSVAWCGCGGPTIRRRCTSSGCRSRSSASSPSRSAASSIASTGSSTGRTSFRCCCCRHSFLHFALVFPDRPNAWVRTPMGRATLPVLYLPALLLGGLRAALLARPTLDDTSLTGWLEALDRLEFVLSGLRPARRARRDGARAGPREVHDRAPSAALDRRRHDDWRAAVRCSATCCPGSPGSSRARSSGC